MLVKEIQRTILIYEASEGVIFFLNEDTFGEGAIFDFVTERLNAGYKEGLKLKFIYMRLIYANTKASNK